MKMEADFINTVISVLLLEGIGRQLDPNLDLFKSSLPILRQLGRQMTTQDAMRDLKDLPRSNIGAMLKVRLIPRFSRPCVNESRYGYGLRQGSLFRRLLLR